MERNSAGTCQWYYVVAILTATVIWREMSLFVLLVEKLHHTHIRLEYEPFLF